jgi:hypothetical protein
MNCNRKYSVYIDSSKKVETSTSSDFKYTINLPRGNKYSKVAVLQLEFPKSYYLIDSTNNVLVLYNAGSEFIGNVTLDIGTYTVTTLAAELQTKIRGEYFAGMIVTFNSKTGKFLFDGDGFDFGIKITSDPSLSRILGLNYDELVLSSSDVLPSQNVVNLQRYNSLYLRSNLVDEGRNGNVLQEMFMRNTSDFDLLSIQNNHSLNWKKCVQMDDQVYDFYITDIDNKVVDLNGGEICVSLLFSE